MSTQTESSICFKSIFDPLLHAAAWVALIIHSQAYIPYCVQALSTFISFIFHFALATLAKAFVCGNDLILLYFFINT